MSALAAPFPYFGGKRRAAPIIWRRFGDPGGYVEPFGGSAAVLLARPEFTGHRVETINDADGLLINAWRAIRAAPGEVAEYASGPVAEVDYHARLAWLAERRVDFTSWLEGDPEACDAKAAGWWLYVMACGIGDPFRGGPWRVVDGRLRDTRKLPHLGDAGRGVSRKLPHVGTAGRGVNRKLPHLGTAGQGVNEYMHRLAVRLARVRITAGDWRRVLTPSASRARAGGDGSIAILLDPPYSVGSEPYAVGSGEGIAEEVRAWCLSEADSAMRIALCGYMDEHDELLDHGWVVVTGKAGRGSGYNKAADAGRRERIWFSPACLADHHQADLFEVGAP